MNNQSTGTAGQGFKENGPTKVLQVTEFGIPRTNHISPRKCTVTEWSMQSN